MRTQCIECDSPIPATPPGKRGRPRTSFCCDKCRATFHARRRLRGSELYDFVMQWRFERKTADNDKIRSLICDLARGYREADRIKRNGRQSWLSYREAIDCMDRLPGVADGR